MHAAASIRRCEQAKSGDYTGAVPTKIDASASLVSWDGRLPLFRHHRGETKDESMSFDLLAVDLGKQSFHIHGIDGDGVIILRKLGRAKPVGAIEELAPAAIAMEACASAHYWGRRFLAAGHRIRLINPRFVKPFVKGSKSDAADAEAIHEAALRPAKRFVPVKSIERQDQRPLHHARERVVWVQPLALRLQPTARPHPVQIAVDGRLQRIGRRMAGAARRLRLSSIAFAMVLRRSEAS